MATQGNFQECGNSLYLELRWCLHDCVNLSRFTDCTQKGQLLPNINYTSIKPEKTKPGQMWSFYIEDQTCQLMLAHQ